MIGNLILPNGGNALLAWASSKSGLGSAMAMLGALVLVTFVVFVWAAFFRRTTRRKHHHHHRHHRNSDPAPNGAESPPNSSGGLFRMGRRRRRRRKERRQNPTLAETGGLPGNRSDERESPS